MIPAGKDVVEDWTLYNEAVRRRAERLRQDAEGAAAQPIRPAPTPRAVTAAGTAIPAAPPAPARPPGPRAPDVAGGFLKLLLGVVLLTILVLVVQAQQRRSGPDESPLLLAPSQPFATPPTVASPVVTNYVIFHRVEHVRDSSVVTGWRFARSGDARPVNQFCYLDLPNIGDVERNVPIANDRGEGLRPIPQGALEAGLTQADWEAASRKCNWFSTG